MASAEQVLTWVWLYWGIENGLHYRRDVTLKEDATRISQPRLAAAMAAINNFVVGLSQKLGFENLASARRAFDAKIAAQLH
jgi:predicted transposase YbfD/YdcC